MATFKALLKPLKPTDVARGSSLSKPPMMALSPIQRSRPALGTGFASGQNRAKLAGHPVRTSRDADGQIRLRRLTATCNMDTSPTFWYSPVPLLSAVSITIRIYA